MPVLSNGMVYLNHKLSLNIVYTYLMSSCKKGFPAFFFLWGVLLGIVEGVYEYEGDDPVEHDEHAIVEKHCCSMQTD